MSADKSRLDTVEDTLREKIETLTLELRAAEVELNHRRQTTMVKEKLLQEEILALKEANAEKDALLNELRSAQAQLMQADKLAALGTLAAGICHEINNKLTPVRGYCEMLLMKDMGGKITEQLDAMLECVLSAQFIMRSLLGFARSTDYAKRTISLNNVIQDTVALAECGFRSEGIRIETALGDIPNTVLNHLQIGQVFMNLINNAVDAVGHAGVVTITTRAEKNTVIAEVEDDGPGMTDDVRKKIFDPFFTTKEPGKGTGLGLTTCYGIIRDHKGTIEVESAQGRGTKFIISLPIASLGSRREAAKKHGTAADIPRGRRILVADDDRDFLDFVAQAMEGNELTCTESAEEALEKLGGAAGDAFDTVILDIAMPEMNGIECFKAIQKKFPAMAGRVMFVTGTEPSGDIRDFLEGGGYLCLLKPFDLQEFYDAVRKTAEASAS